MGIWSLATAARCVTLCVFERVAGASLQAPGKWSEQSALPLPPPRNSKSTETEVGALT
jgi:hypothetical protein